MEYLYRCYDADSAPHSFDVIFVVRVSGVIRKIPEPTWLEPVYVDGDLIGMKLPDEFPVHYTNSTSEHTNIGEKW